MTPADLKASLLTAERVQDWLLTDGLRILLTIALAVVVRWMLHRLIKRVVRTMAAKSETREAEQLRDRSRAGRILADATAATRARHQQRTATLGSLLRSIVTVVVGLIAVLTVMSTVGIDLAPILATAGVGGVALGFGAQSVVKDFLSGVFMILEDQYGVGDVIDTGEAIGTVEEVTLRVTRLRDANGVTWYIRNGEVIRIGNLSQHHATAVVDVPVSYDEDVARVTSVIHGAAAAMAEDEAWQGRLLGTPTVAGVESITGQTMTIRVVIESSPSDKVDVQRELRQRIKTAFDAAGVKAPQVGPFGFGGFGGTGQGGGKA
ncbi:mechanosensitive ion channel family protein [Knoellia subterranea]|uniref:Small mechanosensitive ion channel protein MscS n=1 Tax=Knoellia subterranea KCTC 19937 TaxID=1385521 RepID=A0A0A0JP32_9MICO|nr:mechanosensitive ion channel family protein [Knoellia subterranea]KGN39180.1 small mechanosensitive ion channel protein MscS [Knoellia subterranea KCTC 19937]